MLNISTNIRQALSSLLPLGCVLALLLTSACESEEYETGDGTYSYMRADFVEALSGEAKTLTGAVTDDNVSLTITPALSCSWATTADSIYRALLYYHVNTESPQTVEGISATQVIVLRLPQKTPEKTLTDPLSLESAWTSANGTYLNLGLLVKTGKAKEENTKQVLGLVRDTIITNENGVQEHYLRLLHNQNGVPENYSTKVYASIPLTNFQKGDILHLDVNTYNGSLTRTFFIK